MAALNFDAYHSYSCLAAREVVVPILPLGHKMQLLPSQHSLSSRELKHWQHELRVQHGSHLAHSCNHDSAAGRSMSTEPGARPACKMCSCVSPSSPQQVHHMLRGRDSPVRNALQDCWMGAASALAENEDDDDTRRPWQQSSSPQRLQQDKLLATLEALDLAAERLRSKLAVPAAMQATAVARCLRPSVGAAPAAHPSAASNRKGSSHVHRQRPSSAAPAATPATAARRSPSPSKRYWIP